MGSTEELETFRTICHNGPGLGPSFAFMSAYLSRSGIAASQVELHGAAGKLKIQLRLILRVCNELHSSLIWTVSMVI